MFMQKECQRNLHKLKGHITIEINLQVRHYQSFRDNFIIKNILIVILVRNIKNKDLKVPIKLIITLKKRH